MGGSSNCCVFFQKTSKINNQGWTRWDCPWEISPKRVDQSHLTIESLTIEFVRNAYTQLIWDKNIQIFYYLFPAATKSGASMEDCNFGKILPIKAPKCHRGKFYVFRWNKFRNRLNCTIWNPVSTHPFIFVEALNTLIPEKHSESESCITTKMSRRTQKIEIYRANEQSGLALFCMDLRHFFGCNDGKKFGVMLRGKRPHQSEVAHDIVRVHSLIIYKDLIGYNIVSDAKGPILRCFLFISNLRSEDNITTGHYYTDYQIFSNLQFRPLLECSFHSFHIDLRDTRHERWKNTLCICWYHSFHFDFWRSLHHSVLTWKTLQDGCFKTSKDSIL